MLAVPHKLTVDPSYDPFLRLTECILLTTAELARRWRYNVQTLHNMRRNGTGPAFVKLPGGAVRYRHADVLAYELFGHGGGLTIDRVALALATFPGMKPDLRAAIEAHLSKVLCVEKA